MGNYKNKILYVDPNNIAGHVSDGVNRDNITWKPEDLNYSVDIQVVVPDRANCGKIDYANPKTWLLYTYKKEKTSFFTGEPLRKDGLGNDSNFFLTNSYTNISYTEIKNNKQGNRELLGVESIDITFDSHFFPQVTIKFTDVRGASLMMPEEANYTADLRNQREGETKEAGYKNFFRSLFQFPYPVFYLTVKGYFGTRETFLLSVQDFKSSFNSESGNFDVTVKFIGHMFGVYSDLPLNYLMIAPYIGSKDNQPNEYWKHNTVTGGSFTFTDGTPIPTFIQFLYKFKSLNNTFTEQLKIDRENFRNVKKIIAMRNLSNYLENILKHKEEYDKRLREVFSSESNSVVFSNENHFILLRKNGGSISIPKYKYKEIISNYNDYVKENGDIPIIGGDACLEFYKNIPDNQYKTVPYEELQILENEVSVLDGSTKVEVFNGVKEDCSLVFINNRMLDVIRNGYKYAVVYRKYSNTGEFFDLVKRLIYEIEKGIQSNIEENFEEYNDLAKTVLGFSPTIENVFRMIYAHIDCFMAFFYRTLSNVGVQEKKGIRKLSKIVPSLDRNETDVRGLDDFSLPPYTGFYDRDAKTNLRTRKYPYDYIATDEPLAEVNFIEAIYNGINGLSSVYEDIKPEEVDAPNDFEVHDFTPLMPLDIIYNGHNPYYCLNEENRQEFLEEIIKVFTHRVCLGLYTDAIEEDTFGLEHRLTDKKFSVIDTEKNNVLSSLSERSRRILYEELKQYHDAFPDARRKNKYDDYIINVLKDPSLTFDFYDRVINNLRTIVLYGGEEKLTVSSYDIRKKTDSGNTENVLRLGDCFHSLPIKSYTNLSDKTLKKLYTVDKWWYPNTNFINGILHYDKNNDTYDRSFGNSTDYTTLINKVADGILNKNDFKMGVIMFGNKPKNIKNLYFEKEYLAEIEEKFEKDSPYKRAEILLSCIIGNNNRFYPYVDGKTHILRMPKYVRLFLGSQIYFHEISIGKDGFFNNFIKPANTLNGNELWEIYAYYSTAEEEFIKWVNTDFKKIDALLQKYSTKEFSEEKTLRLWRVDNWYVPEKTFELQQALLDFYLDTEIVLNIYEPINGNKNKKAIELRTVYIHNFITKLYDDLKKEFGDTDETSEAEANNFEDSINPEDADRLKEEIYYTQKGLYDKWLSTFSVDRFLLQAPDIDRDIARKKTNGQKVNGKVTEYNSFVFMDSFYNDIGQTFFVDTNVLYRLLTEQIGEAEVRANRSVYEFISDIAYESKLLLIPLPVYNNFYNKNTIVDIFKPHQIYDGSGSAGQREIGNTYVLMYTHEDSHNLDPGEERENGLKYENDGIDVADTLGEITQEAIDTFCGSEGLEKYTIPAFGVTYAKQNQSYFKNISLNMDNPRQTDFAIYNQFALAAQEAHGDVNSPVALGQNMYSIFSNRSYDCHVEMMGCMNITPMMYFQLNNIPLFKGAYRITKVEHHIKAGDMTTKFSGTRISKNSIPYLKCALNVEEMVERINGGVKLEEPEVIISGGDENNVTIIEPEVKETQRGKISKWFTFDELIYSDTAAADPSKYPNQFKIKPEIKARLKILANFLDGLRDYLGYGIRVTSGYRCPELNKKVGGKDDSAHLAGFAGDIVPVTGAPDTMSEFKEKVRNYCLSRTDFDQCIIEKKDSSEWVHIAVYNKAGKTQRHLVFDLNV